MTVIEGKLNDYTLGKVLGKGAHGITYLATGQYGNQYAIKKFISGGSVETREEETKILSTVLQFCEQHAVCLVESFNDGGNDYIVMDYLKGRSVGSAIFGDDKIPKAKRIEDSTIYEFMKDLIIGLSKIHAFGLVHQDIKPENLMYVNGKVKYIDFGESCFLNTEKQYGSYSVFGIGENEPCGTPGTELTVPPEMAGDLGVYQLVHLKGHDVWSVGCVILSWFIVKDNDFIPSNHVYYEHFNDEAMVNRYTNIFNQIREENELAYQVIIGLLNRDPQQRLDNFGTLVDYFSNPFAVMFGTPSFTPNWDDQSVTKQVNMDLCRFRQAVKEEGLRNPEIFIGAKKCDKLYPKEEEYYDSDDD